MKKYLIIATLILVSIAFIFAEDESSVASMEISAFKDTGEQQTLPGKILQIERLSLGQITSSIYTPYDITDLATINASGASLSNVMKITMGANTKSNFSVGVEFSPFVCSENGDKIGAAYSFSTTADAKEAYQPGNNDPYEGSGNNRTQYQFEYTPSISITGANVSGSTITVPTTGTEISITWSLSKARRRSRTYSRKGWSYGWGNYGSYSDYNLSNISDGATLTGVTSEQYYPVASVQFNLSVTSFSSMEPNVDYIETIRITISGT